MPQRKNIALAVSVTLAGFLSPSFARADSLLWQGGVSADWNNNANWVWDGHVPVVGDNAVINAAATMPTISAASNAVAGTLVVGGSGNGTLTVAGGLNTNSTLIGNDNGSSATSGTVNVSGTTANWVNSGRITVGEYSVGSLAVLNGASVTTDSLYIGDLTGSVGTVRLSGSGSSLESNSLIVINTAGSLLTVENGATLSTVADTFYVLHGGVLSITGAGTSVHIGTLHSGTPATWSDSDGWFYIHYGSASVSSGAFLESDGGYVSGGTDGAATMTVSGAGTRWNSHLGLYVGGDGNGSGDTSTGSLTVADGAAVSASVISAGNDTGTSGDILVTGSGSTLASIHDNFAGNVYVGYVGDGVITVQNGASLTADNQIRIAYDAASTGTLNIGAAEGETAVAAPRAVSGAAVVFGEGNGSLVFNHTSSGFAFSTPITTLSAASSGTIKALAGTTTLGGDVSGDVDLDVEGGALTIASTSYSGRSASVLAGATLKIADGVTANLSGDFTNAGTYSTTVSSASRYSKLVVSGTANLGGTLSVDVAGGNTQAFGGEVTSLIHAGTINGSFATVSDNSTLFDFVASYTSTDVNLSLVSAGNALVYSAVAADSNTPAYAAARVLDRAIVSDPIGALASSFVNLTSDDEVSAAVSQTLPLLVGGSQMAAGSALTGINRVIQARIESNRGLSSGDSFYGNQYFWMKPFGSWVDQDDRNGSSGYSAHVGGLAFGSDAAVSDATRLGVSFAYAKANVTGNSSVAPSNAGVAVYQLVAYGSHALDADTEINFQAGIGSNKNKGNRQIVFAGSTAHADFDSLTATLGAGIGRSYKLDAQTTLIPSIRADYSWIRDSSYTETGAGALNLKVQGRTTDELILAVDGKVTRELDSGTTLAANLGVGYDVLNERASITAAYAGASGAAFTTQGLDPSPWLLRAGLGATHTLPSGVELSARYDAEYRQDFLNQTLSAKVRWAF